jgi:hypothetical protein
MLHFLASMLRSFVVAIMAEKQKIIFRLDSGAHFSVAGKVRGSKGTD